MNYCVILFLVLFSVFRATNSNASSYAPSRSSQVKLLENSELIEETRDFDELDKDMLIIRSKTHTVESLAQKYPQLPKVKLIKLKQSLMELK